METIFEVSEGEVKLWIEQEAIHIIAGDPIHGDPSEITAKMARQLADHLNRLADQLDV